MLLAPLLFAPGVGVGRSRPPSAAFSDSRRSREAPFEFPWDSFYFLSLRCVFGSFSIFRRLTVLLYLAALFL